MSGSFYVILHSYVSYDSLLEGIPSKSWGLLDQWTEIQQQ